MRSHSDVSQRQLSIDVLFTSSWILNTYSTSSWILNTYSLVLSPETFSHRGWVWVPGYAPRYTMCSHIDVLLIWHIWDSVFVLDTRLFVDYDLATTMNVLQNLPVHPPGAIGINPDAKGLTKDLTLNIIVQIVWWQGSCSLFPTTVTFIITILLCFFLLVQDTYCVGAYHILHLSIMIEVTYHDDNIEKLYSCNESYVPCGVKVVVQ